MFIIIILDFLELFLEIIILTPIDQTPQIKIIIMLHFSIMIQH